LDIAAEKELRQDQQGLEPGMSSICRNTIEFFVSKAPVPNALEERQKVRDDPPGSRQPGEPPTELKGSFQQL